LEGIWDLGKGKKGLKAQVYKKKENLPYKFLIEKATFFGKERKIWGNVGGFVI